MTNTFSPQNFEISKPIFKPDLSNQNNQPSDLIRIKEVMKMTGLSRSTIYLQKSRNEFPKSIHLGARSVAWVRRDIED